MSRKHVIEKLQFAQLRTRLADQLAHFQPELRKTLLRNLSELVAALTLARSVQLASIGAKLPVDTSEEAREQWVRRQLSNDTQDTLGLFRPLAESLLAGFAGRTVRLILDPTDLAADLTIVQLSLAYRGRALPLAWLTVYIKPDTVKEAVRLLFAEVKRWLPAEARVYLLGDREFHGEEMLALIQAQQWIPVVRTKGNLIIEQEDGTRSPVADLAPARGQTAFYQRIWLTAWGWGPYSLSLANAALPKRGQKPEDPWYIVSTEPAGPQMLYLYGVRMWADEMYRDLKSQGFHLEQTRLHRPERIDRLMLVLALAYWWVLGRGIWVDRLQLRRRVDRGKHPKCSLFTLGLRWIHRLMELDKLPDVALMPVL
jgi:hypothetical protein